MINIDMTVREMISLAANPGCTTDLYERIVKCLEKATGNEKMLVGCNGVHHAGQYWDQKIPAIKALRTATGWGLKEAKDWVENAQRGDRVYSSSLSPEAASQLKISLEGCGCSCWVTPA